MQLNLLRVLHVLIFGQNVHKVEQKCRETVLRVRETILRVRETILTVKLFLKFNFFEMFLFLTKTYTKSNKSVGKSF
jgi:hypothetical protein